MRSTKVSICVPTYNRPELLIESLESCLAQTHENIEVLIGDDSSDRRTMDLIESKYANEPRIKYLRHVPSLKQADNIANLFDRATGDKILLIHDDDKLTVNCVERLLSAWTIHPDLDIAFGDQYEMDDLGRVNMDASRQLNIDFLRTEGAIGLQANPGCIGLIQMIPNNGWMANADLARKISYKKQYGDGCEFVFGVEICMAAKKIYYLKEYVSYYRKTDVSMSKDTARSMTTAPVMAYGFLETLKVDASLKPARDVALKRIVPIVVSVYARNHQPMQALRIALSHLNTYEYGLSKRLYFHLLLILKGFTSAASYRSRSSTPAS